MKTILKVTFLFALVALANTLFATGNLKMNILPLNNEKAVVAVSALTNSNFNITIADDNNQILYYQECLIPSGIYSKVYDFSDLGDGTYKLTVVSDNLTSERQFQKKYGKIQVGDEKTTLEPLFWYDGNILRYSYLNFEKEYTTLYFYGNDQLIYEKNIGRDFNIQNALNLSKLAKGNYEAVLCAGNKQFTYHVEIQQ